MPTLAQELIDKAKASISDLRNQQPGKISQEEVKMWGLHALTMNPAAIKGVDHAVTYLAEFAEKIGQPPQASKLHSWVTVTTAALGAQAIFNRVLWTWAHRPIDQANPVHDDVKLEIETLYKNYAALIAREP